MHAAYARWQVRRPAQMQRELSEMAAERDALREQCAELSRHAQRQNQRVTAAEARRESLEREVRRRRACTVLAQHVRSGALAAGSV